MRVLYPSQRDTDIMEERRGGSAQFLPFDFGRLGQAKGQDLPRSDRQKVCDKLHKICVSERGDGKNLSDRSTKYCMNYD